MAETIIDRTELEAIIWDDAGGYQVVDRLQTGKSRWHTQITTIFKRNTDGKLFMCNWGEAATEYQDHNPPNEAVECEAYEVVVTRYRKAA